MIHERVITFSDMIGRALNHFIELIVGKLPAVLALLAHLAKMEAPLNKSD